MATVRLKLAFQRKGVLLRDISEKSKRAQDLSPVLKNAAGVAHKLIAQEFSGKYWLTPSGGKQKWAPRRSGKYKHPLLLLSHDLFNSWQDTSTDKITPHTFSIFSNVEYAEVQRGGSGAEISTTPLWNNVIPRPHATRNPELDRVVSLMIMAFIRTGAKNAIN